jgi:GTP-binding protein EngB required for normal cell division
MTTGPDDGRSGAARAVTAAARELVVQAAADLTGPAAAELRTVLAGLSGPLRVAIAGRRNAGKSTLINALLGELAAPTDRLECTRLVAWYRHDDYDHARVVTRDGSEHDIVLLSQGRLPSTLDVAEEEIDDIEVWLHSDAVRTKTIIDTPGYDAHHPETEARTNQLFERHAVDAIVFVLNQNVKADELERLGGFGRHIGQADRSSINTIGVLTKADTLDPVDPWRVAWDLAATNATRLGSVAATVVPIFGLMAETAATERLTGDDAWYLGKLRDLPAADLSAAKSVLAAESEVPVEARERLLHLLGVYGLRYALRQMEAGRKTVPELNESLAEHSGLRLLQSTLDGQFAERAEILRARAAIQEIIRVSDRAPGGPDRDRLRRSRDAALRLLRDPRMHVLRELQAYESCLRGDVDLPDDLMDSLRRLALERGVAARLGLPADSAPGLIRKTLLAESGRWNEFINAGASAAQREVALVAQASYAFAWESIEHAEKPLAGT